MVNFGTILDTILRVMKLKKSSKRENDLCARDRMLELASSFIPEPLTVNCDHAQLYNEPVNNVPLLMIYQSSLIDYKTYLEVLKSNVVFPGIGRDMSYSVELCGSNNNASYVDVDASTSRAPPNVNLFAPINSIRRPVRRRIETEDNINLPNDTLNECDYYSDIPISNDQYVDFNYIQTSSVTSSRLSECDEYNNVVQSNPGYVHLNPELSVPHVNPSDLAFLSESDADHCESQYFPSQYYSSSLPPLQNPNEDANIMNQSALRTVSYTPSAPRIPMNESISPIMPDLITSEAPVFVNLPILYIIPVIPQSIQPVFIAPIQPSTFANNYAQAPLAFNCVLRTPYPQFIYSVEPCQDPTCPFTYRYRCPTPQISSEQQHQRRRTAGQCQFRKSDRFTYQCSNRLVEDVEDDTPKRNVENAPPPPKRRLSDKFPSSPDQQPKASSTMSVSDSVQNTNATNSSSVDTIEKVTTRLDNITLNNDNSISRVSQISVIKYSRRNDNPKRKNYHRTSQAIEVTRHRRFSTNNKLIEVSKDKRFAANNRKRFDTPRNLYFPPRNMCFAVSSETKKCNLDVPQVTNVCRLNPAPSESNSIGWLRNRNFKLNQRSFITSPFYNQPYFLDMLRNGPLPNVLQEVSVPVINNTVCESMYQAAGYIEHIPNIFICAGWRKGGFDSCEGDSGGPMVIQRPDKRWLLAGIISWGIGCAEPNQPGVYTRISAFRDWINQILQF